MIWPLPPSLSSLPLTQPPHTELPLPSKGLKSLCPSASDLTPAHKDSPSPGDSHPALRHGLSSHLCLSQCLLHPQLRLLPGPSMWSSKAATRLLCPTVVPHGWTPTRLKKQLLWSQLVLKRSQCHCTHIRMTSGNLLQHSCLGNPMDRGAWWATVHGVTKGSDATYQLNNRATKIHNPDSRSRQGCEATEILNHSWWEGKKVPPLWKTVWQFLIKLNTVLL